MKIHILTIHHIHNFGSVFQATTLCKFLNESGYDSEIIDYTPPYFNVGRSRLKTIVGRMLNLKAYCIRKRKFESFIRANQSLSRKRYLTNEALSELDIKDEIFIAGGDQLWNDYHPCGKDDAYKLTFVKEGKKLAFGTSMGRNNQTKSELHDLGRKLSCFMSIGLREKSTVELLQPEVTCPVYHATDPVFLFPKSWYLNRYINKESPIKERFAVVYLADTSPALLRSVELLRKQGLKIVHICGFRKKCYCDYFLKDSGPEEILNYIYHAEFVLSGSFHATLFSIMFHKRFVTILPGTQINARIEDLTQFTELSDRVLVYDSNPEDVLLKQEMKFDTADQKLFSLSKESREYLLHVIKMVEEHK